MGSGSLSFDRAAAYYERTRPISRSALRAMTRVLRAELEGRGRSLEVGVGTGVVSIPLATAGLPIVGVDLSHAMLRRIVEKSGGRARFPLLVADATALPFADATFGAALFRHVLHLIPGWERAVDEAVRVLVGGGVLLVSMGWFPAEFRSAHERFAEEAGIGRASPGLRSGEEVALDAKLAEVGARLRALEPIVDTVEMPLEAFIQGMSDGVYSFTWGVEAAARRRAAASVHRWASERFGPLEEPVAREVPMSWRAYDVP